MTFATGIRPTLARARSIASRLGLRPTTRVAMVRATWSGTYVGEGTQSVDEIEILEAGHPPKVRGLSGDEIALGMGPVGSVKIGPITPSHAYGGTALETLCPTDMAAGETLRVKLTGPDGGVTYYQIIGVNTDSALHYTITAEPITKGDQT